MHQQNENTHGFSTPAGYFDSSKQQLLQKINNGGFYTPANYFEYAATNIINKTQKTKVIKFKSYWYAAAAVLLIGAIGMFWQQTNKAALVLTNDEVISYVMQNPTDDLSDNALVQMVQHNQFVGDDDLIEQIDEELIINEL